LQPVDQLGFRTGLNEVEKKDEELIALLSKKWSNYRKDEIKKAFSSLFPNLFGRLRKYREKLVNYMTLEKSLKKRKGVRTNNKLYMFYKKKESF